MTARTSLTTLSVLLLCLLRLSYAQQQQPTGRDRGEIKPLQPESPLFKRRESINCNETFRSFTGTCTNPGSRARKLWGSTNRPQFTYFSGRSTADATGKGLKSPREISNILFQSCNDVFDPRGLNEMATFFGQFVDHNIVATPSNKNEPFPIKVPLNDPVFGNVSLPSCGFECRQGIKPLEKGPDGYAGQLKFFRSRRVRVRTRDTEERPQNSLPSALDLVAVYGPSKERNTALRTGEDGLLKVDEGGFMPLNTKGFNNAPDAKNSRFFLAGDHRANEHPVLTALHTLFVREHNSIARELKAAFPDVSERILFETARKINGAQFQKIVFKDWYPSVTGVQLPRYKKFKKNIDVSVSVIFSTAAFRVGHTMVGNQINRRGRKNKKLPPISFCDMFFNLASFFKRKGFLESVVRGALVNRAQKVDIQVRDALRNFLFDDVPVEEGFDLVAMNLQRGRDHALPSYNAVCTRFGLRKKRRFSQITKNKNIQSNLATAYRRVEMVEAWPGMLAEDLRKGSSLPPCILAIWQSEFRRLRDGDVFYYENGKQFSDDLMDKIPRVKDLFNDNVDTFKEIILRHSDVRARELPKKLFFWK